MMDRDDGRVPVVFGSAADAGAGDHVLRMDAVFPSFHVVGCRCCVPRGVLGQALGRLFLARARGEVAYFRRVIVITTDVAAARAAFAADTLAVARFRMARI